ncbi:MAG: chemotaxis protein CheB [Candidatus Eremiobacteraeota bacterium]|nr:chemotaxis protein CheB [Candidatus Eremiobacteraeota bacterium]
MRLVAIGGSAGALEALRALAAPLRPDLDMAFLTVIHSSPRHETKLPQLLARVSAVPAHVAADGDHIERGHMYVAQAGMHLIVNDGRLRVMMGPKENAYRPSIDVLFRSAAQVAGRDAVGVVISGSLDDGSLGLAAIKAHGGITMVQDPDEAAVPDMPRNALQSSAVDYVLPAADIGAKLIELDAAPDAGTFDNVVASRVPVDSNGMPSEEDFGQPSAFVCPECGGTLWELDGERASHYRCRVGHAYSADTLITEKEGTLEASLWTAVRSLQEQADFMKRIADRARRSNAQHRVLRNFEKKRAQAIAARDAVRSVLQRLGAEEARADEAQAEGAVGIPGAGD